MRKLKGFRKIKLILTYDGTMFAGWQVQKADRTVQGVLESALARMHEHPVRVTGAGRTDAGVHALGQVAHFYTDIESLSGLKFRDAANSYLPDDVKILHSEQIAESFHARRSARKRTYRYYLNYQPVVFPHLHRYCLHLRRRPRVQYLNEIASTVIGEHDFSSFASRRDAHQNRIRKVYSSCFYPCGQLIVFRITANAFLWKMVRSILGTILELEKQDNGPEKLKHILYSTARECAGATAPAKGLFLENVEYDDA